MEKDLNKFKKYFLFKKLNLIYFSSLYHPQILIKNNEFIKLIKLEILLEGIIKNKNTKYFLYIKDKSFLEQLKVKLKKKKLILKKLN